MDAKLEAAPQSTADRPSAPPAVNEIVKILRAVNAGELQRPRVPGLDGLSGDRLIALLTALAARLPPDSNCYLEIGVFQGLTLLSVASANPALHCYGVDNFSQFDPGGKNRAVLEARRTAIVAHNAHLVDLDYEDAFVGLATHIGNRKLGLYFVDGPHDYRSQFMCLVLALPYLAQDAVVVIDDCNYRHVRQANRDFLIAFPEFRMVFEAYTHRHPMNMSADDAMQARHGFWNGVNVLVRDPSRTLAAMEPVTERDRSLYLNDHLIHSSNLASLAPRILDLVQPLMRLPTVHDLAQAARALGALLGARFGSNRTPVFRSGNTYSDNLPTARFHPEV